MNKLAKEIGNRIIEKRKEKKLKSKELAELLDGATIQMVSGWENGNAIPSATYLIKLAKTLDTSTDYILTGKENVQNSKEIVTYKDAIECYTALLDSKTLTLQNTVVRSNIVDFYSNDKNINKYFTELKQLETARNVIGETAFVDLRKKLNDRYDYKIEPSEQNNKEIGPFTII